MKIYKITRIYALILIAISLWAYFGSEQRSATALIPAVAGIILFISSYFMRPGDRIFAHTAVTLTLILLIALIKPLRSAFTRNDIMAIVRVLLMMLSTLVALTFYIRSFIAARQQKLKV